MSRTLGTMKIFDYFYKIRGNSSFLFDLYHCNCLYIITEYGSNTSRNTVTSVFYILLKVKNLKNKIVVFLGYFRSHGFGNLKYFIGTEQRG